MEAAAAGPANASAGAAGRAPSPAPLADAALELFPALNDTALAHEIAADLGLVGNLTMSPQTPSRGGTPGWTTGLLAALISVAVLISMITVFVLLHRNLRRQRREVLASFLSFQEAEAAAVEAASTARQRFLLARASRAAALSPRQPREPPVVVVQPDLSPSLCIKDSLSRASSGGCGTPASSAVPASGSSRNGGDADAAREQAHGEGGPATAAAALPPPEGTTDLEAGLAPAVAGRGSTSAAPSSPSSPVRHLALEFPGLGATVLLVLPSGPNSAGLLMWNDGSGARVLPGAGWRGWGVQPPHEPAPVFQSTIEMAAHPPQLQQEQQELEQGQGQHEEHEHEQQEREQQLQEQEQEQEQQEQEQQEQHEQEQEEQHEQEQQQQQ